MVAVNSDHTQGTRQGMYHCNDTGFWMGGGCYEDVLGIHLLSYRTHMVLIEVIGAISLQVA